MNNWEDQLDAWEAKYQPIQNHITKNGDDKFETYGEEELFVRNTDPKRVWTIVEGDESLWVIAGFHIVDRLGYLITQTPWTSDAETYLYE